VEPLPLLLVLLAAVAATAALAGWTAQKSRQHRRLLDGRIDALAAETQALAQTAHDRALAADRRADALTARLVTLERRSRVQHLLGLVAIGERTGRLGAPVARELEASLLAIHDDAALREQ
jgi:hypothetical protein